MRVVNASPVNDAWQADIGRFVEGFRGADGEDSFAPIEQVWALSVQRGTDA
jgi:L-rhamnose mutarotase